MNLSISQIDKIADHLNKAGINSIGLYDDLFDHFCSLVEELISKGVAYEDAIIKAEEILCPDGAKEIENDLNFLLTIKSHIMVHKLVFIIAGVASFFSLLSAAAWMSNILMPDVALQFIGLGAIVVVFTVYPYMMYRWYLKSKKALTQDFA